MKNVSKTHQLTNSKTAKNESKADSSSEIQRKEKFFSIGIYLLIIIITIALMLILFNVLL
jgi:t-SNARE complex subunit (syntaxin)